MIVTVTLNPSLDRTVQVPDLVRGAVIRAGRARLDPGGKGVNVARALLGNGRPAVAVLPVGGDDGATMVRLLEAAGVAAVTVAVSGATRSNVAIAEPDGTVTKINEPGAPLLRAEFKALCERIRSAASEASWVVISGSLPPELPVGSFAGLCGDLVANGTRVAVDTSGPALTAAIAAGVNLVKPNREELAAAVGRRIAGVEQAVDAANVLRASGVATVLASLGADGAVLVDRHGALFASASLDRPLSCVGAGDALLAGYLSVEQRTPADRASAMAEAVAWATAAVGLPGSQMPTEADLARDRVVLREVPIPAADATAPDTHPTR